MRLKQSPFSLILRLNLVMRFDDQSCEGNLFPRQAYLVGSCEALEARDDAASLLRPTKYGILSRRWHDRKIRMSEKSQSRRASLTIPLDLQIVTEISGLDVTLGSARWVPTIFTVYLNAMALSCM